MKRRRHFLPSLSLVFLILFLILSILFLNSIHAKTFEVNTEMLTNSVCPLSTIIIKDIVESNIDSYYTIEIEGSAYFVTSAPLSFYLGKGEKKTIFHYVTPPEINPGKYELVVNIKNSEERKKIVHEIMVENCHKTSLEVETKEKVCACDEETIKVRVRNEGNYYETYKFEISGKAAEYIEKPLDSFSLAADSTKEILMSMKLPCGIEGAYDLNINVQPSKEYAFVSKQIIFNVSDCYRYDTEIEKDFYELCEEEKKISWLKIRNLGVGDNVYEMVKDAPEWVKIEEKIMVKKGEEKKVNISIAPPLGTEGEFTLRFSIISKYGKFKKSLEAKIKVNKCYDFSLETEGREKVCVGEKNLVKIRAKNLGKYPTKINLKLLEISENIMVGEINKTLEMNPNEEKTILLGIDTSDIGKARIKIVGENEKGIKKDTEFGFEILSLVECYMPSLEVEKEYVVGQNRTTLFELSLRNMGIRKANYTLSMEGEAVKFTKLNPSFISINPNEKENLYLYFAPINVPFGSYSLIINIKEKDTLLQSKEVNVLIGEKIEERGKIGKIFFSIKNFFVNLWRKIKARMGEMEGREVTTKEMGEKEKIGEEKEEIGKETKEKEETETKNFTKNFTTENITENFTKTQEKEEKNKSGNKSMVVETINRPPELRKEIPDLFIEIGKEKAINLSEYFFDPDKDKLRFLIIQPPNITVRSNGSIIYFSGEEKVIRECQVYASDKDSAVKSNTFKLYVGYKEEEIEKEKTEKEEAMFVKYKRYVTTGLLITLLIIIFIVLWNKIEKFFGEEKEEKKEIGKRGEKKEKKEES